MSGQNYLTDDRFDPLYAQVAERCGGVVPLLQTFLGFMRRKTDFFYVPPQGREAEAGFPAGVAERMLIHTFREQSKLPNPFSRPHHSARSAATVQAEMGRSTTGRESSSGAVPPPSSFPSSPPSATSTSPPPAAAASSRIVEVVDDEDVGMFEVDADEKEKVLKGVSTYNGKVTADMVWSQTLSDVTISLPIRGSVRAKEVVVDIGREGAVVKRKAASSGGEKSQNEVEKSMEWFEPVRSEECTWSIERGEGASLLVLTLEKVKETWWEKPFKQDTSDESTIDTTKVDSTRPIDDYDEATQAAIRKAAFDMQQQRLGKKTSDELTQEEALRKAWDAEGSPFKGMPFDPSVLAAVGG
eukprot:CAMPEP_0113889526 /NCGR_PEP_ID=MMETSP0780_2-20120614/13554_1 /TAXON_ID=652834 /ORGANISM="Palpitomonas bilix" /LENGTH=355 /DNA_ID=CAMNT_0000878651 /DNA_START=121 /DNA_END=1184 /DNA_ORIENTATION=+ /assembly_acc=CAM_ASM_000599